MANLGSMAYTCMNIQIHIKQAPTVRCRAWTNTGGQHDRGEARVC